MVSYAEIMARFGDKLNEDQRRVVHDALHSTNTVTGIQGGAGTGKTTALSAIRELAEEQGYRTHGLAPSSRAAKGLKEIGIESETLQAYLLRRGINSEVSTPRLFFLDESSLASSHQIHTFLLQLNPMDRALLIGDARQHQFVEAGRIVDGVELLQGQNRIHSIEHRQERLEAIVRAYAAQPERTLVVSPGNIRVQNGRIKTHGGLESPGEPAHRLRLCHDLSLFAGRHGRSGFDPHRHFRQQEPGTDR